MAEDIFKGGKRELFELKEILEKYHQHKNKLQELLEKQKQQQEYNDSRNAEIAGEVAIKEAEMRGEIIKSFDKELTACRKELDEVLVNKEEKRKEAIAFYVNEKIRLAGKEGDSYKEEMQKLLRKAGLPDICMSKLFFALFYPQILSDAVLLVICLLIVFLALPVGIYYLFCPNGGRLELTTIYLCVVVIFFAVYILINNLVKENHIDTIKKVHEFRMQVNKTEQKAKEIEAQAKELSDEELICENYSKEYLEQVQSHIDMLNQRMLEWNAKCEDALRAFDENTEDKAAREELFMKDYQREIKKREDILEALRKLIDEEERSLASIEELLEKYRPLQREIDIHSLRVAEQLLGYIRNREAKNIGEAIECMKKN